MLTPYGYKNPSKVWKFDNKKCMEVSTSLGYPVVATKNHPFLVLNPDTFEMYWKQADDLHLGDLIAINKNIPEYKGIVDLTSHRDLVDSLCLERDDDRVVLPTEMTKELARLLGYLIAEGDLTDNYTTYFSNSNPIIFEDYIRCLKSCFFDVNVSISESDNLEGYGKGNVKKKMYIAKTNSVRVRRFLYCLGVDYVKARHKKIPEAILCSPQDISAEFLKGFVEGDGCFSKKERDDNSSLQVLIFSSFAKQLLVDIQNLLLSFGIISTYSERSQKVMISGKSLDDYAKKIGFLFKGKDEYDWSKTYFTSKRESMPELHKALKSIRSILGMKRAWKNKKRYSVGFKHNGCGCTHIRWEHIHAWWSDVNEQIKEIDIDVYTRLKLFVETEFLWKPVTSIVDAGNRTVIDPSFVGEGLPLDHAFITGGIVTHNSGQSVTLDYDPQSGLSDVAGRWMEFLNTTLSPAKMALVRKNSPVGVVAGRKYRWQDYNMYTFKIASISGYTNRILGQMTTLGLLF